MYSNNSLISSCFLYLTSLLYFFYNQERLYESLLLVGVGITSIVHHSRLHTWVINDIWCYLDRFMVLLILIHFTCIYYKDLRWLMIIFISVFFYSYNIFFNNKENIPLFHSMIHYSIILFILSEFINNINYKNIKIKIKKNKKK